MIILYNLDTLIEQSPTCRKAHTFSLLSLLPTTVLAMCALCIHALSVGCPITNNNNIIIIADFSIVSDVSLQHSHPDITFVLKKTNEVFLIDIAVPGDLRLSRKCTEKHSKHIY